MDCVSPILDVVTRLWDCTANRAVYICDLQDNLNSLRDLKLELENISKDVETKADVAEQQQYSARTNQVKGWLLSVQLKLKEVDDILQKGEEEIQQKCLGSCCPRHCCTSYRLGKQVIKKIDAVKELINKGHFDVVADKNLTRVMYTPQLRFLCVMECESLEEIIACEFGSSEIEEDVEIFSNLKAVYFRDVPKLKSICRRAMPFSSLRDIIVLDCPSLTKLPFTAETAKSIKGIGGDRHWWDNLEWEDEAMKHSFTSKFQQISVPLPPT
ncbi:hypothetical protein JRO89_XS09G0132100 [Xanthoceras sorbifolium]|uniref:Disease resistance protein At4g27190-like leucine-rich repeats domain-containing protein n=1 Tax=Xanthoceras sorbifolium TaxID=99658 RepID=A0ABQ8HL83_9ROSI|nr:hypothetical protein JRO89_XS09G0132100 [Xanthoceras sorbifolium]